MTNGELGCSITIGVSPHDQSLGWSAGDTSSRSWWQHDTSEAMGYGFLPWMVRSRSNVFGSSSIFWHAWMGIGQHSWPLDLGGDPKNMAPSMRGTRLVKRRWTQPCGTLNAATGGVDTNWVSREMPQKWSILGRGWYRTLGFCGFKRQSDWSWSFDVSRLVC